MCSDVLYFRKCVHRALSGDLAGHASVNPALDPATSTKVGMGDMPDRHLHEDSDNVYVTNSEVESAMVHRR